MAILTATEFQALTGQTMTGADLTALAGVCAAVDAAVRRLIHPFVPEPVTVTDFVCDAPPDHRLFLPVVPVRSVTSVYYHPGANGDATLFTSDDLLTANTQYWLPIDDPVRNYSRSGVVLRRGASVWGVERRRPLDRLSWTVDPDRGALKVTYAAGPVSVPDDIRQAAVSSAAMLYTRRKTGMPASSEGWNGYSVSFAGPFASAAAILSPDAIALLMPYMSQKVAVG